MLFEKNCVIKDKFVQKNVLPKLIATFRVSFIIWHILLFYYDDDDDDFSVVACCWLISGLF